MGVVGGRGARGGIGRPICLANDGQKKWIIFLCHAARGVGRGIEVVLSLFYFFLERVGAFQPASFELRIVCLGSGALGREYAHHTLSLGQTLLEIYPLMKITGGLCV